VVLENIMSDIISVSEQITQPLMNGVIHLVLLGAGSSVAAMPNGDRNGLRLPVMDNLANVTGVSHLLQEFGIAFKNKSFESVYSDLYSNEKYLELLERLNWGIHKYFSSLILPNEPTIYDYLVLSLRKKDFIGTFNWDPFLIQACLRNFRTADIPFIAFLHGNVAIGQCDSDRIKLPYPGVCNKCGQALKPTKLLFPIKDKNYADEAFIDGEWSGLKEAVKNAFIFTIFGYGAPETDVNAVELMKNVWGLNKWKEYAEFEIIDIKSDEELEQRWNPFFVRSHYRIYRNFFDSFLAQFPRRSCEAVWNHFMMLKIPEKNYPPRDVSLEELQNWYQELINAESSKDY
jgi:hypothetical protein